MTRRVKAKPRSSKRKARRSPATAKADARFWRRMCASLKKLADARAALAIAGDRARPISERLRATHQVDKLLNTNHFEQLQKLLTLVTLVDGEGGVH